MSTTATHSIFFDSYHPKKDGRCAISLRITFNRKKRYYPTPYKLTPDEYSKLFSPKPREPYKNILQQLSLAENKASVIIQRLGSQFSFTLFEKKFVQKSGDELNVFQLLEDRAKQLITEDRIGTAKTFECTLSSFKRFYPKSSLTLDQVNLEFLNKYKKWMQEKGNSNTTIGMYLRNIRTIFNEAIRTQSIAKELYPFGKGNDSFTIPTGRNIKKALSPIHLQSIFNYTPKNNSQDKARDFWILSYLGNGINIKDIALLKLKNIDGEMIRFERAKTKRANEDQPIIISFLITEDIKRIMNKWGNKSLNREDFIFPILQRGVTALAAYKQIQLFTAFVNNHMRAIATELNVQMNVTTYVARHSFASILKNNGENTAMITEAFGHKSMKTTSSYLADFEDSAKVRIANKLTDFHSLTKAS